MVVPTVSMVAAPANSNFRLTPCVKALSLSYRLRATVHSSGLQFILLPASDNNVRASLLQGLRLQETGLKVFARRLLSKLQLR